MISNSDGYFVKYCEGGGGGNLVLVEVSVLTPVQLHIKVYSPEIANT
jgi:hypothetical protein